MTLHASASSAAKPVTIEQTSKPIKGWMLIAAASFWLGLLTTVIGSVSNDESQFHTGNEMIVAGAVFWIVLRVRRWWVNG